MMISPLIIYFCVFWGSFMLTLFAILIVAWMGLSLLAWPIRQFACMIKRLMTPYD